MASTILGRSVVKPFNLKELSATRFRQHKSSPRHFKIFSKVQAEGEALMGSLSGAKNVLGGSLEVCCTNPITGFNRDGYCRVTAADHGIHAVCAQMTEEFMNFTASRGNDLSSVVSVGQRWCLCASRWREAKVAGKAPPVILASTSSEVLNHHVTLDDLLEHALDAPKSELK